MNDAIVQMLDKYHCKNTLDYENAMKEIIQEVALLGLWRAKIFEYAAFYGGSALRILYKLDRFSEDLDFTLLKQDEKFDLGEYHQAVKAELESFGFNVTISKIDKSRDCFFIQSAFIKDNTQEHLIKIGVFKKTNKEKIFKIKFEVDIVPPLGFQTESKYLFQPIGFSVKTLKETDLFAGKLHAVLCRSWKEKVKGRDWYDFAWFVSRQSSINLEHLFERMKQSGHIDQALKPNLENMMLLLKNKISRLNIELVKSDVKPFIKDSRRLDVWSKEYFLEMVKQIKGVN